LDVIFRALKKKHKDEAKLVAEVAKGIKITEEEAKTILRLQVRQLSKLDEATVEEKLKKQRLDEKQLKGWIKSPNEKIAADMKELTRLIEV
jgi:DNA gyrase/topoisomerase IV subunit A